MVVVGSYLALYVNYARPQGESLQLGKIQYGLIAKYEFILALFEQLIGSTSKSNTGPGKQFFPLIFSIFTFILLENLIGMLPFSFTPTSHFIVTLGLAVALFIGVTILGFLVHGLHYFSLLLPAGAPLALSPFLVLLELISYVFKAVSLGVRLGANMLAGHCLLKIIAGFSFSMGCSLTGLA